ncbi:MAG TPA: GNAT family N-acetyltransferase [Candidatus Kapabacteria bacterium]
MEPSDSKDILSIYLEGIATGNATLETDAPSWEKWDAEHLTSCRLIAKDGDTILGWAALSPVSGRCVYGGVAEVSIYIAETARGKRVGLQLFERLIQESEKNELWTLQSGILQENIASIKLHEKCGFRIIGVRERIGQREGIWRNVVLMERRSNAVGI